ncbi:MAG: asparagine synthase (glutamine-hydrolyzing) [Candidatus Hydrogenedentes bacterium]|nr:asparagine synthase (glutamine-hydrolyzing) [Candidatus Hydrogenedentota bacterium]
MCGICGIAKGDTGAQVDPAALERMNRALTHRGPDDAGVWLQGHVGLAMRRLKVLDLAGGHQPMLNDSRQIAIVFNGEIYNYRELRAELEKKGCAFRTQSDTEVLLRAYEAYGDDALHKLNGMFAFALYDANRDRLLLARDRLGIKPLFYTIQNGSITFASELDALLRSGAAPGAINPAAVDAYFTFLYVPAPDSIYTNIEKLLPGEKLVFENGQATRERYWRVNYAPDSAWTLDSAADRYLELMTDAIRLQRVSDVPLGAFLSGGLDSSTVVGLLSFLCAEPIKTFTIGFDDPEANELEFARIAADHFGTDHTEEVLRPDMVSVASELVRHFGEPFADASAVPTWLVSRLARRHVTVALSGDGGDELFAGYTWAHVSKAVDQYRKVPAALRSLVDTALRLGPESPKMAKLRRFSGDSFQSPHQGFRRRETCFAPELRAALYSPDLLERVSASAIDRFQERADEAGNISDDDRMLYQDLTMYLPDDILTKVDRMSMANGLEARVPILDHRIVEFSATVPFHLKYKGAISKRLVKHAVKTLLPPKLLTQRKRGFAIPVHTWFRGELRSHFEDTVLSADSRCAAYLNTATSQTLLREHVEGRENYGHHLWSILMFEHWLRYVEIATGLPSL